MEPKKLSFSLAGQGCSPNFGFQMYVTTDGQITTFLGPNLNCEERRIEIKVLLFSVLFSVLFVGPLENFGLQH